MAISAPPYHERRVIERRRSGQPALLRADGLRVSWGGVFGGVLVAFGLLMLLAALGVAIGISAVEPGETDAATLGLGAGIYAGVSLLLALFVGGMVSTRIGAIFDGTTGFFEGALVWVVSVLLMAYMAGSGIGMLAGGAFQLVGGATQAIGTVMQGPAGANVDLTGTVDQVIARLQDPGTTRQIAAVTGLPPGEVSATLSEIAQRMQSARDNPAQALAQARQGIAQLVERARAGGALERAVEEGQPEASRAAWIAFAALLLSLAAAVIGALAGRRNPETLRKA